MERMEISLGDIAQSRAEAVVIADGQMMPGGCPVGEARLSIDEPDGRCVLHTAGPVWQGGGQGEAALLARCYRSCLELAAARGCRSVDVPSISTGEAAYPALQAAHVALKAMVDFLREHPDWPVRLRLLCRDQALLQAYQVVWNMLYQGEKPHA